jgi:hypothetical protein
MKFKHLFLATFLSTSLLAGAHVGTASEKQTRKETRTQTRRAVAATEQKRPFWSWTAFRPSMDKPCDSTACRPQRFPWSPTAPGA